MSNIVYPLKCNTCEHIANSPASWHYHKRKHEPIPPGTKCDGGCGNDAISKNTNNKYYCAESYSQCPQYLKEHSEKVKNQWDENEWPERKLAVSLLMSNSIYKAQATEKMKITKYKNLLAQPKPKTRRKYNRLVHNLTKREYKKNKRLINPHDLSFSRTTNHLDHKVSKHVGWMLQIPAIFIGNIHNLEVLDSSLNESKASKCSIHPIQLLITCEANDELIQKVQAKISQLGDSFERLLL